MNINFSFLICVYVSVLDTMLVFIIFHSLLFTLLFADVLNSAFSRRPFKIELLAQIIFGITECHRISREIKILRCSRGFIPNYRMIRCPDSQLKVVFRKVSASWSVVKGDSRESKKLKSLKSKLEKRLMRLVTALIVSSQNRTNLIR